MNISQNNWFVKRSLVVILFFIFIVRKVGRLSFKLSLRDTVAFLIKFVWLFGPNISMQNDKRHKLCSRLCLYFSCIVNSFHVWFKFILCNQSLCLFSSNKASFSSISSCFNIMKKWKCLVSFEKSLFYVKATFFLIANDVWFDVSRKTVCILLFWFL